MDECRTFGSLRWASDIFELDPHDPATSADVMEERYLSAIVLLNLEDLSVICTVCCKSFEGLGVVCSACAPSVSSRVQPQVEELEEEIVPGNKDRRFAAFMIDGAIVQLLCIAPQLLACKIIGDLTGSSAVLDHILSSAPADDTPLGTGIWSAVAGLVIWVVVRALWMMTFECSSFLGTPGKLLVGLKVVHQSGRPLNYIESGVRNLAFVLPWIVGVLALLLLLAGSMAGLRILLVAALLLQGWIFITTVTKGSNGWHDSRVGAVVADRGPVEVWRTVVAYTLVVLIASVMGILKAMEQRSFESPRASSPVTYSVHEV